MNKIAAITYAVLGIIAITTFTTITLSIGMPATAIILTDTSAALLIGAAVLFTWNGDS